MYRCAILDDYQNLSLALADWSAIRDKVEPTVFDRPLGDLGAVAEALKDFDIVVLMRERTPFPRALIERLPKLKFVVTTGMRNGVIDAAALADRGVPLSGTGSTGSPTVQIAVGLMLELARQIGRENARLKGGVLWQSHLGADLEGRTLGIVGLGKLGARVSQVGQALGMKVIAWSQNLTPERCAEVGVAYATREELFARADVVSLHVMLSPRTRGLIGSDDLARMKPTAFLVNTARGPLVDEAALVNALREQRIAGAGLDVFDIEPLPLDHPFRTLDNVVLTPHLGYATQENFAIYYRDAVADIRAWLDGKPVRIL